MYVYVCWSIGGQVYVDVCVWPYMSGLCSGIYNAEYAGASDDKVLY